MDARKLKVLEAENSKLKKLLADQMLDNAMLKDIASKVVTPEHKLEAVVHLCNAQEVTSGALPSRQLPIGACRFLPWIGPVALQQRSA